MKNIITAIIAAAIIIVSLWYGINKTINNRCDYYRTLDMTPAMQEMCK